jgi:hypothetical protein
VPPVVTTPCQACQSKPGSVAGDRRHVRHQHRLFSRGGAERRDLAALDVRHRDREVEEHRLGLAADDVEHGERRALVRHVLDIEALFLLQHLHEQVVRAAAARRSVVELAGIPLHLVDEVTDVPRRERRRGDEKKFTEPTSDRRRNPSQGRCRLPYSGLMPRLVEVAISGV